MEAGGSGTKQSGIPPTTNPSSAHFDQLPRDTFDRPYREAPTMATATLISPSASYHAHHSASSSSFSSGYPHSVPASSIPGMISPVDSRRTSDESESGHRQLLPSIQEVISGSKPGPYAPSIPSTMAPAQSLPSPFSSGPSRPFSDIPSEKNPSPRTLHPSSSLPRPEPLPAFSDPRPPVSVRPPPPPLNTYPPQHPSPPLKMEQHEAEPRHADGQPMNGNFPQQQPPPSAPVLYPQTGQLPQGQLPLPSYPVSPRQAGPALPSPFEPQRPPIYGDDGDFGRGGRGNKYENTLNRHFEAWSYGESLGKIAVSSRTIFNFAEAFEVAAREQHGGQPIPSRLPTEQEIADMIANAVMVKKTLEDVRTMVHQSRMNERAREGSARKVFEEEDVAMYGDGMKPAFGITEVKKRRGRAAPPGRCHSCNRIDTPEWRRGPDGARTLCNACGLHYAKLERKRQMEQRSIRPKPSDERS